jgi:hypothetical protein
LRLFEKKGYELSPESQCTFYHWSAPFLSWIIHKSFWQIYILKSLQFTVSDFYE